MTRESASVVSRLAFAELFISAYTSAHKVRGAARRASQCALL